MNRWIQSIDDQGTAASRLWDAAPAHYKWADVERVCREQLPPLPSAMELAEKCFSAWDGNHDGFERLVKAGLNDPNSMEVHGTYFGELDRLDERDSQHQDGLLGSERLRWSDTDESLGRYET